MESKDDEDILEVSSDDESEYDDLAFYDIEYTPKIATEEDTSGISFKGESEEFRIAHKAIETMMTKQRNTYNVEGNQVFVKSVPKASRITLEVTTTQGDKGCVGLLFYKPKKGKISFRITKQRREESKLVTALAKDVFTPLLRGLISGTMNEESLMKMQIKTLNKTIRSSPSRKIPTKLNEKNDCSLCGNVFDTKLSLEVHMNEHKTKCEPCNFIFKCPNTFNEHKKLCSLKVETGAPSKLFQCDSCLEVLSNKLTLKNHMTQHENFNARIEKTPYKKKTEDKCETCGTSYEIDTARTAEIILEHKIKCRSSKTEVNFSCNQCSFRGTNSSECEDHMKNLHSEIKSPDSKKSKIETDEEETLSRMKSLSFSERNPPDLQETKNEGVMEIDTERKRKRDEVLKEKPTEETNLETTTEKKSATDKDDPNTRLLPKQVEQIVSKGSKEAIAPGDGTCLIGTTALHIEGDTEHRTQLAKDLNTHIGMYRDIYLPKIEADFPLTVTIGVAGKTKTFLKGQEQEYFDWLVGSLDAVFMWRGCLDIIALSNMLRMEVDCIVHQEGSVPEVYHFCPDRKFPFLDEDKSKPKNPEAIMHPKMTILNYKDNHFNLIVEKNSMIANLGSFTHQRELARNRNEVQDNNTMEAKLHNKIQGLEEALKVSLNENQKLKEELHTKNKRLEDKVTNWSGLECEECSSTFKNRIALENHISKEHFHFSFTCQTCGKGFTHKQNLDQHKSNNCKQKTYNVCKYCNESFQEENHLADHIKKVHQFNDKHSCQYCENTFLTPSDLQNHKNSSHQFNSMECDHQAHKENDLLKHMKIAHQSSISETLNNMGFKCVSCAQVFERKDRLMNHRRDTHGKSKTKCRYNVPPLTCNKGEKECVFDHSPGHDNSKDFKFSVCSELCPTKSQVLNHRKNNHPDKVAMCKSIKKGDICRYNHYQADKEPVLINNHTPK